MKKKIKAKKNFLKDSEDGRRHLKMRPLRKKPPKSFYLSDLEDEDEEFDIFKEYRSEEE